MPCAILYRTGTWDPRTFSHGIVCMCRICGNMGLTPNSCADSVRSRDCALPILSVMITIATRTTHPTLLRLTVVVIDGIGSAPRHSR